jgi:cysteine synthase
MKSYIKILETGRTRQVEEMHLDRLIGNTPMVQISDKIYAKLETYNPSGSIKDRMAYYIINRS